MNELSRRILMTILGVSICGLSVGLFSYSGMGLDPFQVFAHGTWSLFPLDYGTYYVILNAVLLIAIFFINRKKIGLGTLINLFLVGYMAEFSENCLIRLLGPSAETSIWLRAVSLIVGIVIMCFSAAMYFTADMGVSTYDAVAITLDERKLIRFGSHAPVPFKYIRIATDLICVIIGGLLGGVIGVGTLVAAFFMGPLISFFNRTAAIPMRYGKNADIDAILEEQKKRH